MILALALLMTQPSAPPSPPPAEPRSRFGAIVTDWGAAHREALAAEQARVAPPPRTEAQARSLGERVGRMVAEGDCQGGERAAREAADFALVRAVQAHCRTGAR
jgi:hypothetical protein